MKQLVGWLLLTSALLWPPLAAADFEAGMEAQARGDFASAYREFLPLAEQGDAIAQVFLGSMYATGQGVPEDYVHAYAWVNLAAAQGLGIGVKIKDWLRPRMTAAQIAQAQELSWSFLRRIEEEAGR